MMKKVLYLIFCISNIALCQNNYEEIVKPRLSFVSDKTEATDVTDWVIIDKDTFYSKYKTNYDLSYLNKSLYSETLFFLYEYMVFQFTDENSEKIDYIQQWSSPIVVYMDDKLPKIVRTQFEDFYSQIDGIENLKISFASRLEDANYFIKTTSKTVNGYGEDYKFSNEDERKNNVLTGGTYSLQSDNNNKYYSGILTINPANKDEKLLLKQLKQMFFMSLGRFFVINEVEQESILSTKYVNTSEISELDLKLLKLHYGIIYDQYINSTIFNKLIELSNQK